MRFVSELQRRHVVRVAPSVPPFADTGGDPRLAPVPARRDFPE